MANPAPATELPAFYQRKRVLFRSSLANSRFTLLPADGTYFQCVRYDAISELQESAFAEWLTTEIKVAAIPVSAFYAQGLESGIVRFCFAKRDDTLRTALERLARLCAKRAHDRPPVTAYPPSACTGQPPSFARRLELDGEVQKCRVAVPAPRANCRARDTNINLAPQ